MWDRRLLTNTFGGEKKNCWKKSQDKCLDYKQHKTGIKVMTSVYTLVFDPFLRNPSVVTIMPRTPKNILSINLKQRRGVSFAPRSWTPYLSNMHTCRELHNFLCGQHIVSNCLIDACGSGASGQLIVNAWHLIFSGPKISEVTLIPWWAFKKGLNCLIQFWFWRHTFSVFLQEKGATRVWPASSCMSVRLQVELQLEHIRWQTGPINLQETCSSKTPQLMHTKDATAACKLFCLHDGCLPAQVESVVKIFQHLGSLCLILHGYGLAPGNSSTAWRWRHLSKSHDGREALSWSSAFIQDVIQDPRK